MPETTRIQYGRQDNVLVIKMEGPCTAMQAARVQRLLHECLSKDTSDIYFDLSQTSYMDSSFAGELLGLALRNREADGPRICLQSMPPAVNDALQKMHVLHFFQLCDATPVVIQDWQEVAALRTEFDELADLVINAHEKLIEVDPRNADAFGRVVEGLRDHRTPPSE